MMRPHLILASAAVLLAGCDRSGPPGSSASPGYHVRPAGIWYASGWPATVIEVKGVDRPTFRYPLAGDPSRSHAADRSTVFCRGIPVPQADPATFGFIDGTYSRDARHVFRGTFLVCDDPDHFEVIGLYVKNSHAVYDPDGPGSPEERVVSTDVANFRNLAPEEGTVFHGDSRQLIVAGEVMTEVDPAGFRSLGTGHWTDGHRIHYRREPMPEGTDMATFQPLVEGYARDAKRAYYLGKVLPGSDGATFVVTDPKWPKAKDIRQRYNQGEVLPPE